ncbi:MAG: hypothetical protein WD379_09575 [Dehalococcoidia bacterium]
MATEVDAIKAYLASVEREVSDLHARLKKLETEPPEQPRPFSKLLGIWKGADFTYEEIKAAEYRLPEDDWE